MASMFFFFKMAAIPTNFHHISDYSGHTVVIFDGYTQVLGVQESSGMMAFTHKNALKLTWWPFCFSKWPLIQPMLDIDLSQPRMFAELSAWDYTQVFWAEE